ASKADVIDLPGIPVAGNYELDATFAGMDAPSADGGSPMDQEIDNIVNKVTKPKTAKSKATPPAGQNNAFGPAKPVAPKQTTQKPTPKPAKAQSGAPTAAPPKPTPAPAPAPAMSAPAMPSKPAAVPMGAGGSRGIFVAPAFSLL